MSHASQVGSEGFVVTGGSSGIGAGIVTRLLEQGHRVAVLDRVAPTVEEENLTWIEVDLASPDATRAAARAAQKSLGSVYGLVHCAAFMPFIPFTELTDESWALTLNVNVTSAFVLAQEFAPSMRAAQRGRMVFITSSSQFSPPPGLVHYVASKGALTGLVRTLAHELGDAHITVNAVAPGLTATDSATQKVPQELFDLVASNQAIPRTGQVADQVGIVTFLLGPEAGFITGQTILVDGGESHL
jgi:NAD(P)-dependent dehydrogenase (short-subunit alcohol dehydrogenase family)